MKPKLIRILFAFAFAVFALLGAEQLYAQDASPVENYEDNEEKENESIFSPGEPSDQRHKVQSSSTFKDSTTFTQKVIIPRNSKSTAENTRPESKQASDDSILSFNFLYYIIQKYKLQDIVD